MKRLLMSVLVLLTLAACKSSTEPDKIPATIVKAGSHAQWWSSGKIIAAGAVKNAGDEDAHNVQFVFKFYQAGVLHFSKLVLIGDIGAGATRSWNYTFSGPRLDPYTITWEYEITWD